MTDFLIVHDAGQGARFWNKVWGSVTAPEEHPPRLYTPRYASQFYLVNLPGHGSDEKGDTGEVRLDECTQAIVRAVERRGLKDLVLVGHGVGGMLAAQAAPQFPVPPRRLVMVSGVVPEKNRSALSQFPVPVRKRISSRFSPSRMLGKDIRLSPNAISRYMCNGMETNEINQAIGFFGPLPTTLLETPVELPLSELPCPVTYVVLDQNRFLSPNVQIAMARRIPAVSMVHLESCHQAPLHKPVEMGKLLTEIGR